MMSVTALSSASLSNITEYCRGDIGDGPNTTFLKISSDESETTIGSSPEFGWTNGGSGKASRGLLYDEN